MREYRARRASADDQPIDAMFDRRSAATRFHRNRRTGRERVSNGRQAHPRRKRQPQRLSTIDTTSDDFATKIGNRRSVVGHRLSRI
jgi:hypothetical protein